MSFLRCAEDQLLVRKLIGLCSTYGRMDYAALVFHQVETPHAFTWNLMIREYTISGSSRQAILLYNLMICEGYAPDKFTFPFVIKACSALSVIDKGRELHGLAIKTGLFRDLFVHNTLMDLYFKCGDREYGCKVFENMPVRSVVSWTTMMNGLIANGDLDSALEIFEGMPEKNVVSWTAMINGFVKNQRLQEAFDLFRRMQLENVKPNEYTLVGLLRACIELGSLKLGRWIHEYAVENGFRLGVFLGTALIDMYSKCDSLADARQVFVEMEARSLATWNSMITSLGVHGFGTEALSLYEQMEKANVAPDAITFVGVLSACVHTNNLEKGVEFFKQMTERYGIPPISEHYNCLIELYNRARELVEEDESMMDMPVKSDQDFFPESLEKTISHGDSVMENSPFTQAEQILGARRDFHLHDQHAGSKWDVG
ncbi:pentatricopeptide repeat-containing protein At3g26630, chloroplastic-like isoform X2 [Punica granatum]|uniref:Pentatricopeptide repeat-containing protein At3g26630, chloroplastic-like isoform X2 n=1 Tax=Punica granatum TaxID=22663 RepID=A0A6P8DRV9_PUNGR|nr:pentatricopeptide repeat-containing protein At3g26630, chloroplastic-like isoform X2 [Punica granatum]